MEAIVIVLVKEPKFWGSWKGRVIKAIVVDNAHHWNEIRDSTGLFEKPLNKALAELFNSGYLHKRDADGTYWVTDNIYREYNEFFNKQKTVSPTKFSEEKQKDLVDWIDQWREVKNLDFSLDHKHFYLIGNHLDDISDELIRKSTNEVLIVNPFVEHCNLTKALRDTRKGGVNVRLITRPPESDSKYPEKKRQYHDILKKEGIELTYNDKVHAKIITVDRAVAIVSSMNFNSYSSGGGSWEAGLISVEESVVESVAGSILRLVEKPESKSFRRSFGSRILSKWRK